jgi:formate hydrogenlyase subunit 7
MAERERMSVEGRRPVPRTFRRSLHIRHVDAGSDGGEESEILALTNPYYDISRLGMFFTPSPRHADVLLVTGAVTRAMEEPLRRAYEAMPDPKLVVAVGTDACSGGVYGESYATVGGVDRVVPVDVYVPGSPPSPLAIIYGLLLAVDRIEQKERRRGGPSSSGSRRSSPPPPNLGERLGSEDRSPERDNHHDAR